MWRCIVALCALVWLLPTVGEHVPFQVCSLTKWISTFCTFVNFLPRWAIMCLLNFPASPKDFSHSEQEWAFTPLWVSMCLFRCPASPNDLLHWRQGCLFSLLWVAISVFWVLDRPRDLFSKQNFLFSEIHETFLQCGWAYALSQLGCTDWYWTLWFGWCMISTFTFT